MVETADTQLIDEQFRCIMAELDETLWSPAGGPVASRPFEEPPEESTSEPEPSEEDEEDESEQAKS